VLLTAFGRAISEVGRGDDRGRKHRRRDARDDHLIALETSKGDLALALALGLVLLAVVGALNLAVGLVQVQRPPRRRWRAGRCLRPAAAGRGLGGATR
jgi:ABC-type tungstate transport system substrate-binding protein